MYHYHRASTLIDYRTLLKSKLFSDYLWNSELASALVLAA